jgi:hypothetical protein
VTGYVLYVDNVNVFRNFAPSVDTWVTVSPGAHTLSLKAWDARSSASTRTYHVNIAGFAPPSPPPHAHRL